MINSKQQITSRGIAQISGLEIFNTVTTYDGEYLNWGNALAYGTQLGSDITYNIQDSSADPQVDALTESPPTLLGVWSRYNTTDGLNYKGTLPPTSGSGYFTFNGASSGSLISYGGIYQKMSTVVGNEYKIDISNTINSSQGTLYVNTYFARYSDSLGKTSYKLNTSKSITYPRLSNSDSILTSNFIAQSPNDIIVIYFTPSEASSSISITNISVKEKQEYLVPVSANDIFGNAHKVLRVAADQTLSDV